MKIRTEVTKIEHKTVTEKNNEIHHLWQAWLSMKGKSLTGKIRNEKEDITIGTTDQNYKKISGNEWIFKNI